jgi:3-dehydroquinate synthase
MKKIRVKTTKTHEIYIEKGLVKYSILPEATIITDKNISQNYPQLIKKHKTFVLAAGEKSKSEDIYLKIIKKLNKDNSIIAFGGGVVGDIAGFVASTYKRGISLIQIPTSLLAMIDSSIGGKNGINLGDRKNYLGTIYQPEIILIDPLFLEELPKKEFQNGVAEIIKYSIIFGQPNIKRLQKGVSADDEDLEEIIFQSCKIKAKIVGKDEFDKDYRHTLNFGHTIGHAIELLHGLSHGEAISIGMMYEAELGKKLGMISSEVIDNLEKALKANNLPTKLPENYDADKILNLMKTDKKGELIFSLSKKHHNIQIKEEIIRSVLTK